MHEFERTRLAAHERLKAWESGTPIRNLYKTLVIIDMQSDFLGTSERNLIPVICRLIQFAKRNELPIILVKFLTCGNIDSAILKEVKDYHSRATVYKTGCDGGREVIECLVANDWSFDLLVCGVWGNQCVTETVSGLFNNSDVVEVSVVTDAVYPPYLSSSEPDEHGQQKEAEMEANELMDMLELQKFRVT